MIPFFWKRQKPDLSQLRVDIHSHLLPQLDDGVQSMGEALEILRNFERLGFEKVITTPHIMGNYYANTPEIIERKLDDLKTEVSKSGLSIEIEAAAEYYMDDQFISMLDNKDQLLTFGDNYLLVETSYMNEPMFLNEVLFKIKSLGLKPVIAHPERYLYLQEKPEKILELVDRGALMQLNVNSIIGFYSIPTKKLARWMVDHETIHFLGSDCHNLKHFNIYQKTLGQQYFKKALSLSPLNTSL